MSKIYRDEYTDFIFNEICSSDMKVWITNNHDLSMPVTPSFSDNYVSPTYGQGRYLTQTTVTNTDITLSCIAIDVTMQEWRAIQQWLSPSAAGKLQLSYNKFTYYDVKISKQISGTS